jgi:hypothetical protein
LEAAVSAIISRQTDFEAVPLNRLHIDREYQRHLNLKQVAEMAARWDIALCDTIKVSKRADGTLWVIDGQHRVEAAKKAGEREIFAQVLTGLTPQQEADIFYGSTVYRRGLRPLDKWRASLRAEHPNTVEINEIVNSLGGAVNRKESQSAGINAVGMLWKIYEYGGAHILQSSLSLLRDAWPMYQLGGITTEAPMMAGAAFIVGLYDPDELDRRRMVNKLASVGPESIRIRGRSYQSLGKKVDGSFYLSMLDAYNKGKSEERKLVERRADWRVVKTRAHRHEHD